MDNKELLQQIAELLEQQTTEMKLYIENSVTTRIDALFDGYKLTHEKQWELERQTEALKKAVENLQARIAVLEEKTA